jgi:hypothetical protein
MNGVMEEGNEIERFMISFIFALVLNIFPITFFIWRKKLKRENLYE